MNRIIIDTHASTGSAHECKVLPDRIVDIIRQFDIQELVADKGYGRGPTYDLLDKHAIKHYIPLHSNNLGEGKISRGDFKYDRNNDRYVCPKNRYLYPYEKLEHGIMKRYRMVGGHCRKCDYSDQCLPDNLKHRARFIYRSPYQDKIDFVKKIQNTKLFKSKLLERKWKIEGIFAEAKALHCLSKAKYRGIKNFQIQCYVTAITQNIKRILNLILLFFIVKNVL